MKPVAWIKIRELSYMKAVAEHGKHDWQTNLGLKPEPDDEGLYTETQVQDLMRSFEQSVTDPENQPSQYGTVLQREWQGLTDEECDEIWEECLGVFDCLKMTQAKLKEKNSG
jgi:hypothetical protein